MPEPTTAERALIAKVAGEGHALVQAVHRRGAMSLKAFSRSGRPATAGAFFGEIAAVAQALCEPNDDRVLILEVNRTETGYRLSHTFALRDISPAEVLLDPEHRYPNHPSPGMPRPEGIDVTDRPTDPAVLAEVRALVGEYIALYTSIKGTAPDFGEPLTEAEILAAETAMGLRLPEDVRALYRCVHSDSHEHGLLGAQSLLPLDSVVHGYVSEGPGTSPADERPFPVNAVVFDADPPGVVRRVSRSDWWVTVATDMGGNSCAIDLDPAAEGTRGQLIEFGRDFHGPVGLVAASVTEVLRQVVTALRAGAYEKDEEPGSTYLILDERVGRSTEAGYRPANRVGPDSTASVVERLTDPLTAQLLYLNDAEMIELAALTPLANLRALSINRAARVTTPLPHELPVESLRLSAADADLALLSGHPDLWQLELAGLTAPVAVEALAALPALSALDLSEVDVDDVEALADLTGLRVLTLNAAQWSRLREADRVPPHLAAARMAGRCFLDEAVTWREWLTGKTSE
ncbi:SMI1/KNR4 family protein [Phytomonospora endophytica]|uniref:Cell wall assembly regulator SMI1 n=1 Tax=Phytomonospora endophytica TaxID=714109 RepID=A0A841FHB4_9ACTN|nr:SMI1/KNR4 family protein [Phytomonospora endophytica]MBB6035606.1 cell wall assembly regulator SMI1 [Phytomonospora endophytica]GIG70031.1 hypothetical protein Pen01_63260 [Phytomonospora endophytica]